MAGVTAKELAARLGLSPSAVSLALNGKPGVSEQTRATVMEEAGRLGFGAAKIHRGVNGHKRICFAFYVNKLVSIAENTTFSSFVLQGVESAASALGYSTQVRYLRADDPIEKQAAEICRDADGVILLGTDLVQASLPEIQAFFRASGSLPVVMVDSVILKGQVDCVANDNAFGSAQAVNYLLERGCRRIGYLRSRHRILNFEQREQGLRTAVKEAGLELDKVVDMGISFDEAIEDMNAFLDAHGDLPDGFFAENDVIAAAAIRALRSHNVALPERVSVVGFDDIPICDLTDPSLTTVHSYKEQLGEVAVTLLQMRMQNGQNLSADTGRMCVTLSTKLHVRGSVK